MQSKRLRGTAEDGLLALGGAGQDAEQSGQEQLPAKRKRTQLFSVKDIMAGDKAEGECLVNPRGSYRAKELQFIGSKFEIGLNRCWSPPQL
jgi:hypothetical protein